MRPRYWVEKKSKPTRAYGDTLPFNVAGFFLFVCAVSRRLVTPRLAVGPGFVLQARAAHEPHHPFAPAGVTRWRLEDGDGKWW